MLQEALVNFFFPQTCFVCGLAGEEICADCLKSQDRARMRCLKCGRRNHFGLYCPAHRKKFLPEAVVASFAYKGGIRELVHRFKYEDGTDISRIFAWELARTIKLIPDYQSFSVGFIPLAFKRERRRGYNQAKLLAEAVAGELGLPLIDLLLRADKAESQVQVEDPVLRRQNIKGVFRPKKGAVLPKQIILIDDVVTTGATAEEAAKVLLRAGVKRVFVVALALA